jgi:hypothetical protein
MIIVLEGRCRGVNRKLMGHQTSEEEIKTMQTTPLKDQKVELRSAFMALDDRTYQWTLQAEF